MYIKQIVEQFDIKVIKISPIKSAVLSKVYLINDKYILRSRVLENDTIQKFNNEQNLLNKVRDIVSIKFPNLLSTKSDKNYFIYNNSFWTVYSLIGGEILSHWWNLEKLSEEQKEKIFKTLKQLHLETIEKLDDIDENNQYNFIKDVYQRLLDSSNHITADEYKRVEKAINIIKKFKNKLSKKDLCFIHGDYHPGNVIFRENEVVGLLDFDFSRKDVPFEDLAYTLMMFLRDYQKPFEFNEENYFKFLNWYGVKKEDFLIINEYLILFTFYDFHLLKYLEQIPNQDMFFEFQRDFLRDICLRFT